MDHVPSYVILMTETSQTATLSSFGEWSGMKGCSFRKKEKRQWLMNYLSCSNDVRRLENLLPWIL